MTGMIWSKQVLEYPLFALGGAKEFPAYHCQHNQALPDFVILPSLAAFVSAIVLLFTRPARLPQWSSIVVVTVELVVIVVTVAREAPLDSRLDRDGHSEIVIRQLVRANWIRTILWIVSAIILLVLTAQIVAAARSMPVPTILTLLRARQGT